MDPPGRISWVKSPVSNVPTFGDNVPGPSLIRRVERMIGSHSGLTVRAYMLDNALCYLGYLTLHEPTTGST